MGQDFFSYLPSEMIINILSRLPARTAIRCKCVCKPWLNLLATPEFVKSHLSKAAPGLAVFCPENSTPYKILEFLDELDPKCPEDRWNVVFSFHPPFSGFVHSSANGLLLLCTPSSRTWNLILCNPVTRDYIKLPCPQESKSDVLLDIFGLGVSRMSEQIKLVEIFYVMQGIRVRENPFVFECQVYTVGTGSWRRIGSTGLFNYDYDVYEGVFLNGNLHWLAHAAALDLNDPLELISCFDLETELFSTFSPHPCDDSGRHSSNLSVLGGCLCLCSTGENDTHIWLMKEYGEEKSWTKEFVIRDACDNGLHACSYPIKVFQDGDILMKFHGLYYSNKTKSFREVDVSGSNCIESDSWSAIYTPSFVTLRTFAMENVSSF